MIAALLLAANVAVQASPTPVGTPLKQIIDVRSRPLCSALTENVRPAVAALLENDTQLFASQSSYEKMARVMLAGGHVGLYRLAVRNQVTALVRNLDAADTLLADPQRFSASPATNDERLAAQMKAELQKVVDAQKLMLNLVNGMLETDELSMMQHELGTIPAAFPSSSPGPVAQATAPATNAGLPYAPQAAANLDPRKLMDAGLLGQTLYGTVAQLLDDERGRTTALETTAAQTIASAASQCNVR